MSQRGSISAGGKHFYNPLNLFWPTAVNKGLLMCRLETEVDRALGYSKVTVYHEDTGEDEVLEIRMVYNGTSCGGLNSVIWVPWFALPTGEQMTRTLDVVGYWGADNDYGDMFLNFKDTVEWT
jgi:hypothetical protein